MKGVLQMERDLHRTRGKLLLLEQMLSTDRSLQRSAIKLFRQLEEDCTSGKLRKQQRKARKKAEKKARGKKVPSGGGNHAAAAANGGGMMGEDGLEGGDVLEEEDGGPEDGEWQP